MLLRALGVREAVIPRMLARQEWNDTGARHVGAEVRHEVPEVVLLLQPHGAVGQEDVGPRTRQAPDGMVRVDPRVHAGGRLELDARRSKFGGDDRLPG